jgi:hypothetical protein
MTADTEALDESTDADEEFEIPRIQRYTISAYGADYPIDALYQRLKSDPDGGESDIYIPDFQRGFVWTKPQADRFIESLLLGLPIPAIFLSKDDESNRLFVIDGSQRLRTIKAFMDGIFSGKEFVLGDKVHEDFRGLSYKTLLASDRRAFRDVTIHAIIVRQERPEQDNTSVYYLFERLNTGGTPAQPHEVRRAIFEGELNDLLGALDDVPSWRDIYGPPSKRFKDQELILRFLALRFSDEAYGVRHSTMKDFLTHFMARYRRASPRHLEFATAFVETINFIHAAIGPKAFRSSGPLNAAIFDAITVATSQRLEKGPIEDLAQFRSAYERVLSDETFADATTTGTSQSAKVVLRLSLASQALADVR